jgi:hypothetical protein
MLLRSLQTEQSIEQTQLLTASEHEQFASVVQFGFGTGVDDELPF